MDQTDSRGGAMTPGGEALSLPLRSSEDVVRMRQVVREQCVKQGFGLIDQTKLVTAASELARNVIDYGGGGEVAVELATQSLRKGVKLVFSDRGPGIPDIDLALKDGHTTGNGLGLGLGGAKRLSSEFHIESTPGQGTRITIARWR
jgi:serine/threonine-protein kinase RsbT